MHDQKDPLPISPLSLHRAEYFWGWIQDNKETFDDYTGYSWEEYLELLFSPASWSYEIGSGVGLATYVSHGVNAFVQMIMLDWRFRPDVCERLTEIAFRDIGFERITSTVSEDRNNARDLVEGLGFVKEGVIRCAFLRNGFKNVELWGLTKEVYYGSHSSSSY